MAAVRVAVGLWLRALLLVLLLDCQRATATCSLENTTTIAWFGGQEGNKAVDIYSFQWMEKYFDWWGLFDDDIEVQMLTAAEMQGAFPSLSCSIDSRLLSSSQ